MKRLFNTNFNREGVHFMLLILRVAFGLFMIIGHGYPKFQSLMEGGEIKFGDPVGMGVEVSFYLAVFAEFACSVLLILGLGTRLVLVPLIITMLIAVFVVHLADGFDKKEMGLHFLSVYLFLMVAGPGKYSLDHLIGRNSGRRRR